jgi:hypothetical protein
MCMLSIQDQLAGQIEAIERKHATIHSKFEGRSSKRRQGGTEARGHEVNSHEATKPRSHEGKEAEERRHEGPTERSITTREEECVFQISNLKSQIVPVARDVLATGLIEIDYVLGGGLHAGVHEWYGRKFEIQNSKFEEKRHGGTEVRTTKAGVRTRHEGFDRQLPLANGQFVPLCLFVHLAWRALEANPSRWIIWVGKKCFPYPAVLARDSGRDLRLLQRSLFVRAESPADRVWVADLAVRSGLAGAVMADGTSLDMAATRRLQLAAKSRGAFVFLARPPRDLDQLSAASTRWMVGTASSKFEIRSSKKEFFGLSSLSSPQWTLELLRCKGMQPSTSRPVWLVEWNRAANVIGIPAPVCDLLEQQATRQQGNKATRRSG